MNKKSIYLFIALIALSFLAILFYQREYAHSVTYESTKQIKKEYEALNNTIRESDGASYNSINIDASIELKVLDAKEAIKFIKNDTGVLIISAPWCPWCRNALPVAMEVAKANNIPLYYLDITDIRNTYEVRDKKLVKTKEEEDGYYDLLSALDSILGEDTYKLKDDVGKEYDTKEKRIYIPSFIALKSGEIVGSHVSTVKLNENQTKYDKLTDSQIKDLKNIYQNLVDKTKEMNVCTGETMCD